MKPKTWPKGIKLGIPAGAAAAAFALQSIAGFDSLGIALFAIITGAGVVGAFFAVWLPLNWEKREAQQVNDLQQEVAALKQEREEYALQRMYQYLDPLFKAAEYTQRLTGLPAERRSGFEQAVKERAVRSVEKCAIDVPDLRVTFFHFEGANRLSVAHHSESPRGVLSDLVAGTRHADYVLDAISNNVGGLERNLKSSKSALRWPTPRNFQTLAFFPVRAPGRAYGVLVADAPIAGALEKQHYNLVVLAAQQAAGNLALCDRAAIRHAPGTP